MKQLSKTRAAVAAFGCSLILTMGTGSTTTINSMIPDILAGTNASLTVFMLGPTLATIGAFLGSLVATKAIDKLTPRWSLFIGTVAVSVMLAVMGMATNVQTWIAANAVNGIVLSFGAHAAASGVVSQFYGTKTQSAYGVVSGVYYLVLSIEVFFVSFLLTITDYRSALFIVAGIHLVVGTLANFALIGRIPKKPLYCAEGGPQEDGGCCNEGLSLRQALRTPSFYLFCIVVFFGSWTLDGISAFSTLFLTTFGMSNATAASLLAVHAAAGAVLTLGSGVITARFGGRVTASIVFVCFAAGVCLLLLWAGTGITALAYAGIAVASAILLVTILPSLFIPDLFGMKSYVSINAAIMSMYFLGNATAMTGLAAVAEAIGINNAFALIAVMGLVALVFMLLAYALRPTKRGIRAESRSS